MINESEALRIARARIEPYFDVQNLTPEVRWNEGKWEVEFRRSPQSPGGEPRLVIDGETGEVLEFFSTQ